MTTESDRSHTSGTLRQGIKKWTAGQEQKGKSSLRTHWRLQDPPFHLQSASHCARRWHKEQRGEFQANKCKDPQAQGRVCSAQQGKSLEARRASSKQTLMAAVQGTPVLSKQQDQTSPMVLGAPERGRVWME